MLTLGMTNSNLNFKNKLLLAKMGSVLQVNLMKKVLSYAIIRNSYYKLGDILNLL